MHLHNEEEKMSSSKQDMKRWSEKTLIDFLCEQRQEGMCGVSMFLMSYIASFLSLHEEETNQGRKEQHEDEDNKKKDDEDNKIRSRKRSHKKKKTTCDAKTLPSLDFLFCSSVSSSGSYITDFVYHAEMQVSQ